MKKFALPLGLAVLAVVAVVAWQLGEGGSSGAVRPGAVNPESPGSATPLTQAEPSALAKSDPLRPPAPATAGTTRVASEPAASAAAWPVTGRFRRAGGGGVAGVPFTLSMYSGFEITGEPLLERELETDAEGRFELALEEPDGTVCFDVTVTPEPARAVVVYRPYVAVRGEGAPEPIDVLVFERDATVAGVVRGPEGRPVAGASVEGMQGEATTAADGTFSMAVSSRGYGRVVASADGHGTAEQVLEGLEPGEIGRVELTLPRGATVRGTVTDALGRALEGARITVFGHGRRDVHTDAVGRYVLDRLSLVAGERTQVSALAAGFVSASEVLEVDLARSDYELDFALAPGVAVRGRVEGPDGAPVAGAEVWIGWDPHAWDKLETRTDDEGRFALEGVRPGVTKWGAEKPGFAAAVREVEVRAGDELVLALERPRAIRGLVRDEQGAPREGVSISATQGGDYVGGRGRSGADGAFELDGLPPRGGVRLEAYGKGLVRTYLDVDEGTTDGVVLTVPAAGVLVGRVVDAASGAPLDSFTVRITWPEVPVEGESISGLEVSWTDPGRTFDDSGGRWSTGEHDELEPGAWAMVEVSAPGYATRRLEAVRVSSPGDVEELLHALEAPVDVEVSLRGEPGDEPVPGARVVATRGPRPARGERTWEARTGAAGVALLEDVSPGPLHVRIEREDRADLLAGPFEIAAGRGTVLEIAVPVGQPLEVELRSADGATVAGAPLLLVGLDAGPSTGQRVTATTDAQGLARFEGVAPGRWNVGRRVGDDGAAAQDLLTTVAVAADAPPARVVLEPSGDATIAGRFEEGADVPDGTLVRVTSASSPPRAALTREGRFTIEGVPTGTYRLEGWYWDRGRGRTMRFEHSVEVRAGENAVDAVVALDES